LRRGLILSGALVFLSSMKELSIHLILSPSGYSSLAMEVWDRVENVEYASAAPYALSILICSSLFVLLLFSQHNHTQPKS
jgi:iron(III) transport system permease protein